MIPCLAIISAVYRQLSGYQASHMSLQAIISASPVIGNIFTTMDSNDGDSMHSEGSGPLNKLHPSGSPTGVLDSTDLQMDIHQTSHSISVPQVSLGVLHGVACCQLDW